MSQVETPEPPKEKKKKKSGVKKSDLPAAVKDVAAVERREEVGTAASPESRQSLVSEDPASSRRQSSTLEPPEHRRRSSAAEDGTRHRASFSTASRRGHDGILKEMDDDKLLELKEAFQLFDMDQDGLISFADLRQTFITLGQTDIGDKDLQEMLSEASNPLDFDSFVQLLGYKTVELDPEEVLMSALAKWDADSTGLISEERIKHDLMTWGDKFTAKEVEIALEDAPLYVDKNTGVGVIDYVRFCKTLCGLRKKTRDPVVEDFLKH